ncbi:MAG: cytochrome c3 family protein [Deltaproteobacteria bacterium]|nr:cytochrome c3 family protein [Deltaproteobacteria bacterium]
MSVRIRILVASVVLAGCWLWATQALATVASAGPEKSCTDCHDDEVFRARFAGSVHGNNSCTSCHADIRNLPAHMTGNERPAPVNCGSCHQEIARDFRKNFHYLQEDFRCTDCHRGIHALKKADSNFKLAVIKKCTECHANEEYVASGHAESVLKGNQDSAACSDCHGLHDTRVYHTSLATYPGEAREFYTQKCKKCHTDKAMMARYGLSANIVRDYEATYHGKVEGIGYPTRVAGCADCHTAHNILPKSDTRSSIHPNNLIANCGRCHRGFHPRFVNYNAHPDHRVHSGHRYLFWTFFFMSGLLIGTFLFFWVHTLLWWRKSYWEKHKREKLGGDSVCLAPGSEGLVPVQRFSFTERIIHVLLIFSFMALVMTGFPLKYHAAPWAQILIGLWGGAAKAGLFHRIAATLLSALFLYVAWLSFRFVFPKGQGTKGWLQRLLGPDSLCPNLKDLKDMAGMFRWFFNRGEMPKFDRWTYWEKFDFMAVFWGMFAIGGSGFLLWIPEWSSWIVPGWVLNMAALVHSEEALLAALFIFTVHFFNTHFIPTKFPMDTIVFTGRYRLEEMKEQKPLQYERLEAEGKIEALKRKHPGIPLKILSGLFGLASLLLGLTLTILILWAIFLD